MDNNQIPQMPQVPPMPQPMSQPMQQVAQQPVQQGVQQPMQQPVQQGTQQFAQTAGQQGAQPMVSSDPRVRQAEATAMLLEKRNKTIGLIKTIAIIVLCLVSITFVGLFIWMNNQYIDVSTDVNGQIEVAVRDARQEQKEEDDARFAEEEKYPLRSFVGPVDYGELYFEYPKTWSVYLESDASMGGNFQAYFNPLVVEAVSATTINALRVSIFDQPYDNVIAKYKGSVQASLLSVEAVTVGGTAGVRYTGRIPGTEFNGVIVVFKIRDKTVVLQTDAMLFLSDFDAVISSIQFNQ